MSEYSKLTFTDSTLITAELMNQLSDNIEYALETPPSGLNVNGKTPDETGKITLAATDVNALYLGDAGTGDAPSLNAGTLGGEKPQSPIMSGTDGIYPLTTADQVIKADGSRLEQNGKIVADDSAKLGGEPATTYALKADLDKKANKSIISDAWQSGKTYNAGAYCIYNDSLYKALVQTTTEPMNGSDWENICITDKLRQINKKRIIGTTDSTGDIFTGLNDGYIVLATGVDRQVEDCYSNFFLVIPTLSHAYNEYKWWIRCIDNDMTLLANTKVCVDVFYTQI